MYQRDSAHCIQNSDYSICGLPVPITARSQRQHITHADWPYRNRNQSRVKAEQNKDDGGVFIIIIISLEKHAIANEKKNHNLKIFPEQIEVFFTKICRPYNYNAKKVI